MNEITHAAREAKRKLELHVGERIGRLIVLGFSHTDCRGASMWHCLCDCDTRIIASRAALKRKNRPTRSCGCICRQGHLLHLMSKTPIHKIWRGIVKRCTNPNDTNYHRYGGRGIRVCDRWLHSFNDFYADMGDRPFLGAEIDRIDNDGNYEPGNCRWASRREQARNTRKTIKLEFRGERRPAADWADIVGLPPHIVSCRIRTGWSAERALTTPIKSRTRIANNEY